MLKIERMPMDEDTLSLCKTEREKAEAHFGKDEADEKTEFDFREYKNAAIATALQQMFHGKCAYCETVINTVQPTDIEHYRPKGGVMVNRKLKRPGYYWLAADWNNLLPSCIFCNRPNRHELPEYERKHSQGKGSEFPLEDELQRVAHHKGDILREMPLILNPCGPDDPDEHLEFEVDGWIRPRKIGNAPSSKGEATIRHLALQRPGLIHARKKRAAYVLADLKQLEQLAPKAMVDADARYFQGQIFLRLYSYLDSDEPYIAMTRSLIERQHPGLLPKLAVIVERVKDLPPPRHEPPLTVDAVLQKLYGI